MLETNKIYNMDCLEGLKQMEDKSVDLVITDPFYVPKAQFEWKVFDDFYWDWNKKWLTEIKRIVKDDFHFFVSFSSDEMYLFEQLLREVGFVIKSRIVWNYRNSCKATAGETKFAKTYEFIFHCSSGKKINFPKKWDDKRFDVQVCAIPQSNFSEGKIHPYQKPLRLWEQLIDFCSDKGDVVLDPFSGGGTTAVACKKLGRNFVGFELDKKYYEDSLNRLSETPSHETLIATQSTLTSQRDLICVKEENQK